MMGGNMIGKAEAFSCFPAGEILTPAEVTQSGEMIEWRVNFYASGEAFDRNSFQFVPADGALDDLLKAARGGGQWALDFARRRGVLGIYPQVSRVEWKVEDGTFTLSYREPIQVYGQVAHAAASILEIFEAIKAGTPVEADAFFNSAFHVTQEQARQWKEKMVSGGCSMPTLTPERAYTEVLTLAAQWYNIADFRLALSGLEFTPLDDAAGPIGAGFVQGTLSRNDSPYFVLDWGDWRRGAEWDAERAGHPYRGDGRKSVDGWVPPQRPQGTGDGFLFPITISNKQRPSATFNALAFQLMRKLVLPEGTYFCIRPECRRPYTLDEKRERMQAVEKGRGRNAECYARKPRKDKGSFCSPECEEEQKRVQYRESKRRSSKEKKAGAD